jgi:sucrose phosphorylase
MGTLYEAARKRIRKLILEIYPEAHITTAYLEKLYQLIERHMQDVACSLSKWDQTDTVLITYGGSISRKGEKPLQTLNAFLNQELRDEIRCVHILPFFPYSSDDGFSVIDHLQVDPELGSWKDLHNIRQDFDLMADLVINHVSSRHQWFQNYLRDLSPGKDFFIEKDPATDLSMVTRPRSTPLLTQFQTSKGERHVWTTFSSDQIDLDFSNPRVLYEMLRVLFFYINQGIRIIRLDAIAYLWKEVGTACIHLPQTHRLVKLIRELAELINPDTVILTETNGPDRENLSYFGPNYDEAHMIYQFPLPPLMLHALHTQDAGKLAQWARSIPETDEEATFLNFTASHDGIGLRPAEGIIPEEELHQMVERIRDFGGYVSTRSHPDGSHTPCEINITWFDAMKGTGKGADNLQKERFLCSQTIMMAMKGIPAFYIHSLIATENDHEGVADTGKLRSINRKKWRWEDLEKRLKEEHQPAHHIFHEMKRLIRIRTEQPAFHPNAGQTIMDAGASFFAFQRNHESGDTIWCISNVTDQPRQLDLPPSIFAESAGGEAPLLKDLIGGGQHRPDHTLRLWPYQTVWLKKSSGQQKKPGRDA